MLNLAALAAIVALTPVRDSYPSLSPDGETLLFQSNRSGRQAIWLAKPGESDPHSIFEGASLGSDPATPVWSPDGSRIAFAMRPAGTAGEDESDIYVMDRNGRHVRRLTRTPGDDSHPHWTADGKRIFFNSARATPDLKADWSKQWLDIYSMAADGSDVRRHTECRSICTYPVPSPDGRYVAYRKVVDAPGFDWSLKPTARNSEVFVSPLAGGTTINISANPAFDGWPMWSPSGRWLVFASNRGRVENIGQVFAVRPDGSDLRELTSGQMSHVQPSFSADGKHLYVYENLETAQFETGHLARLEVSLPD